jgi:archaellin
VIEVSATDGSNGDLEVFNQIIKLSPGSEAVKLSQVLLTVNTYNTTSTMTYCGTTCNHTEDTNFSNGVTGYGINITSGVGYFTAEYLQRGSNPVDGNLQRGDVIRFYYTSPRNISEDEQVRINFIPKIGTPTLTEFITPEVISEERIYLYP